MEVRLRWHYEDDNQLPDAGGGRKTEDGKRLMGVVRAMQAMQARDEDNEGRIDFKRMDEYQDCS